jgi:anti-anti-sigma regulatory factor
MRLPGAITVHQELGGTVLCLVGEIDAAVVEAFTRGDGRTPIAVAVFDAGAVTFLAAAGVGLMLRWAQASVVDGQPPLPRRSARCVGRVLHLMGLDENFRRPGPS